MSYFSEYQGGAPVRGSDDLTRVLRLPRRDPLVTTEGDQRVPAPELARITSTLERHLSKGDVKCQCETKYLRRCAKHLLPVQAWALYEIVQNQGLFGPIGVGDGKTLLDLLAPMVMPSCKRAVLLVPNALKTQLLDIDWHFYAQHWRLPNLMSDRFSERHSDRPMLYVVAYSELSGTKSTDLLESLQPDTIIADEGHNLRHRTAARTKRFLRQFVRQRNTRLCVWSGTLVKTSLEDYAHLAALSLGEGSPAPLHPPTVEEWASAMDPMAVTAPPGELSKLCEPGEPLIKGWHRRLVQTPGVVCSPHASNCDASLTITERKVLVPDHIKKLLRQVEATWERPDGEELIDILSKARVMRELSCGFYYKWVYPRGEPQAVRDRWFAARKAWFKEVREKLQNSVTHMDSEALVTEAARRWHFGYEHEGAWYQPGTKHGPLKVWPAQHFVEWDEVQETVEPETETVWEDKFLVQDAADWLSTHLGIVWYSHEAFGVELARVTGAPLFGEGTSVEFERGDRSVIASSYVHGTGKNLQMFRDQLVANIPTDWEQLLGRTHRQGQLADEVQVSVYRHTETVKEALDKAIRQAQYVQATVGGQQKLTQATINWSSQ